MRIQPSQTQPLALVSARDLREPGRAQGGEAPLLLGEVGKDKFGSCAGGLLTGIARSPSSFARTPLGEKPLKRWQPERSSRAATAASNHPGVAGMGGRLHIITRRLRFCRDAGSIAVPTQLGNCIGNPLSQQPPRLAQNLLGIVVSCLSAPPPRLPVM